MKETTAHARWLTLDGLRRSFISDCETYAKYTLPKICPDGEQGRAAREGKHDYQAVGAQGVNHLTNKLMLALFAPSRPFMRVDVDDDTKAKLAEMGITESQMDEAFSVAEKGLVKKLDGLRFRPQLYQAIKHLIITGNVLLHLEGELLRIIGIKKYCVKRNIEGKLVELIVHEKVKADELKPEVAAAVADVIPADDAAEVDYYRWCVLDGDKWSVTQWVMDKLVPGFGQYKSEDFPYHPLVWDLADEDDYGTGLIEEYSGDFYSLSMLSEAEVKAAILASEFRWLVNPAGMTTPEDFQDSDNGEALPGTEGDIVPLAVNNAQSLQLIGVSADKYIRRLGQAFLLGSAVTRDAERVTAEEIRIQAQELETSLGGVYSRLAVDFQYPLALHLIKLANIKIAGTKVEVTIVTGLDALSRSADHDNLMAFMNDVMVIASLPPHLAERLRQDSLFADLAAARGLLSSRYVKSEAEYQQAMQQQAAMQAQAAGAQAGEVAAAEAANQPQ